jgi:hypothetical protein
MNQFKGMNNLQTVLSLFAFIVEDTCIIFGKDWTIYSAYDINIGK